MMNIPIAALAEGVGQALAWAIEDPLGHASWHADTCHPSSALGCSAAPSNPRFQCFGNAVAVFQSTAVPPVSIHAYVKTLTERFGCSNSTYVAALLVVDRLQLALGGAAGRLPLTAFNVHRVFLASLVVAVKYTEDIVYKNKHYAKWGGVHLKEVNRLEMVLLRCIDFDLRMTPEQYQKYEEFLLNLCRMLHQESLSVQLSETGGQPVPDAATASPAATAEQAAPSTRVEPVVASASAQPATGSGPRGRGSGSSTQTPPPAGSGADEAQRSKQPASAVDARLAAAAGDTSDGDGDDDAGAGSANGGSPSSRRRRRRGGRGRPQDQHQQPAVREEGAELGMHDQDSSALAVEPSAQEASSQLDSDGGRGNESGEKQERRLVATRQEQRWPAARASAGAAGGEGRGPCLGGGKQRGGKGRRAGAGPAPQAAPRWQERR